MIGWRWEKVGEMLHEEPLRYFDSVRRSCCAVGRPHYGNYRRIKLEEIVVELEIGETEWLSVVVASCKYVVSGDRDLRAAVVDGQHLFLRWHQCAAQTSDTQFGEK